MKTFSQFLTEGVTDVLFHATVIKNAYSIVMRNAFAPTLAAGAEKSIEYGMNYPFFMSAARSISSDYIQKMIDSTIGSYPMVIFKLDGRKIGQKFAGKAVSYFKNAKASGRDEAEDRIYTSEPFIKNFLSYVTEVHILDTVFEQDKKDADSILLKDAGVTTDMIHREKVVSTLLAKGIPVYIYTRPDIPAYRILRPSGRRSKQFLDPNVYIESTKTDKDAPNPDKPSIYLKDRTVFITGLTFIVDLMKTNATQKEWMSAIDNYDPVQQVFHVATYKTWHEQDYAKTEIPRRADYDLDSIRKFNDSKSREVMKRYLELPRQLGLRDHKALFDAIITKLNSVADEIQKDKFKTHGGDF